MGSEASLLKQLHEVGILGIHPTTLLDSRDICLLVFDAWRLLDDGARSRSWSKTTSLVAGYCIMA